jgi:hypothetical protein
MANTMGFFAIFFTISCVNTLPLLRPMNTSAPSRLCSNVILLPAEMNSFFRSSRSLRLACIKPLLSNTKKFSRFAPSSSYNLIQAMAAAPAPFTTNLALSIFFFCSSSALSKAAALIMAVPCWSSCITGIFICFFSSVSI